MGGREGGSIRGNCERIECNITLLTLMCLYMYVYTCIYIPQEERKAQSVTTHQLPGIDVDLRILFTKVYVYMYYVLHIHVYLHALYIHVCCTYIHVCCTYIHVRTYIIMHVF